MFILIEQYGPFDSGLFGQGEDGLSINLGIRSSPLASVFQDGLYPLDGEIRSSLFDSLDFVTEVGPDAQFGNVQKVERAVQIDERVDDQCTY